MRKTRALRIQNINTTAHLGVALRRLRKQGGLTQTQLAKVLNMRQPTVSDLENGRGTLESFFKLVQALQLNLILTSKGDSEEEDIKNSDGILSLMFKA